MFDCLILIVYKFVILFKTVCGKSHVVFFGFNKIRGPPGDDLTQACEQ